MWISSPTKRIKEKRRGEDRSRGVDASRLKILYKARQQIDIEKRSLLFYLLMALRQEHEQESTSDHRQGMNPPAPRVYADERYAWNHDRSCTD
jgi:hypothetical protein